MKKIIFIGFFLSTVLQFISCETPINEFEPKNEDEKQIIAVLNTYLTARNSGDLSTLQSTFHDNGIYISGSGREVKAHEIVNTEPEWWTSDGEVKLYDPEIAINGNEAKVMAKVKYGNTSYSQIYSL